MKIVITNQARLSEIVQRMVGSQDDVVELELDDDGFFSRHPGNIELLKTIGSDLGKSIQVVNGAKVSSAKTIPVVSNQPSKKLQTKDLGEDQETGQAEVTVAPLEQQPKRKIGLSPKAILIAFIVLVVILVVAGSAYVYFYLPRGTVTLYVGERVLERNLSVQVDSELENVDTAGKVIPGQLVVVEQEETNKFESTGEKTVGEKATGTVEIRNFTSTDVKISAGTILTSDSAQLQFATIETVIVPEAVETSPDENTRVSEASVVEVGVEAVDIGDQYNVAANDEFTIDGYSAKNIRSDLFGVSVTPFTGGSTEVVKVITNDDQVTAQEQLKSQLLASANDALKMKISEGFTIYEDEIDNSTKFVQFSNDVGEEVAEFSVTLKIQSSAVAYREQDLEDLLKQDVRDNIPDGFELSEENIVVKVEEASVVDDVLILKSKISALVVPVLNTVEIRDQLVAKRPIDAENLLRAIESIEGYDVRLWPALPDQFRRYPFFKERLEVKVEVKVE